MAEGFGGLGLEVWDLGCSCLSGLGSLGFRDLRPWSVRVPDSKMYLLRFRPLSQLRV